MVVSYLATRIVKLPFKGINDLVTNSDFKLITQPNSANTDIFKFSKNSIWQKAWQERMKPNIHIFENFEGDGDVVKVKRLRYSLWVTNILSKIAQP